MEETRLKNSEDWKMWGPYLSERQWGTVREDCSEDGNCWNDFTHDEAVYRAYRWGEDGLLGIADDQCRLCLALALWNGKDPILKERLFGLTNSQGNHGEDVKELYYYLDSTPTHSYMKALYKYPQPEFPYKQLEEANHKRTVYDREYEILDTGMFKDKRYFDVMAEYCKSSATDILGRYTVTNRGPETATIHVLPTLWFKNVWSWGHCDASVEWKPSLQKVSAGRVLCRHPSLGMAGEVKDADEIRLTDAGESSVNRSSESGAKRKRESPPLEDQPAKKRKVESTSTYVFETDTDQNGDVPTILFTENDTNYEKIENSKTKNQTKYVKDAFHRYVIQDNNDGINETTGTKCTARYICNLKPGQQVVLKIRLYQSTDSGSSKGFRNEVFDNVFEQRKQEADDFNDKVIPCTDAVHRGITRQAYAGLLWTKQFYYLIQKEWSKRRKHFKLPLTKPRMERNIEWRHLFNKDIISMPDKWEFPWYAAWDLALQSIPLANVDAKFAMSQLELLLQDGYLQPDGRIPAFEFSFSDSNPPVHAYAVLKVFKKSKDIDFLKRCFKRLLNNFNWWVENRSLGQGHLFTGGFLGFDNISVFDRSNPPLRKGFHLAQADATAWMAMYCLNIVEISLFLAKEDSHHTGSYEDHAVKFLQHFQAISNDMNKTSGLWNAIDKFYYDQILSEDGSESRHLRIKSMVGLVALFGSSLLRKSDLENFPKISAWVTENRNHLCRNADGEILLSLVKEERLRSILGHVLDEEKFLSAYGIRSLSKEYQHRKYHLNYEQWSEYLNFDREVKDSGTPLPFSIRYEPGESLSDLFGGNSNWRGPVWMPVNYLLIEGLRSLNDYFGKDFKVECPLRSGKFMCLKDVAKELSRRVIKLFEPDENSRRPCHGSDAIYVTDAAFKDLCLFYEYFHGDTGRGCGASHQTGWTALIVNLLDNYCDS